MDQRLFRMKSAGNTLDHSATASYFEVRGGEGVKSEDLTRGGRNDVIG